MQINADKFDSTFTKNYSVVSGKGVNEAILVLIEQTPKPTQELITIP